MNILNGVRRSRRLPLRRGPRVRGVLGALLLSVIGAPATAATYYVDANNRLASDANPGNQSLPWKSIQRAASLMVGGDTAVVASGTYGAGAKTVRGGTAGSRITFVASGEVNTGTWTIAHDYVTVKGFHLKQADIMIENANYCEVLDNEIVAGSILWATLAVSNGCHVKGNFLHGATSPLGDFVLFNVFGTNHVIEGNEIGASSDVDAFRLFGSNHVVRNNYVHDLTYSPNPQAHMDIVQTFGNNGWVSNNMVIENNFFVNSEGQLFNLSQDSVAGIHDYIIRNNVFANFAQNANIGIPNVYFYNNTLYNTGMLYQVVGGVGKSFNGTNFVVKNNILVGVNGCVNKEFVNVFNNPSNLAFTRSYNFYANCVGQPLTNYRDEAGGINGGSVHFVNPVVNDFAILSPSSAIGSGTVLPDFSYDILGKQRPKNAPWDLGAFQFTGMTNTGSLRPPNLRVR